MCWICLKVQLVGQTDGLGVGKDKRGRGVWITPSYLASVIGCLMEPFSKMGTTVERVEFVGKGQVTSDVLSVRCQQIGSVGCMGLGLRGEVWAGTIDVEPYRWRLER